MANEYVSKYFDALLESYDILVDAVSKTNERGIKVSQNLVQDVVKGQRDAIELSRKLVSEPSDVGQFYTALLESATAAQGRALTFAQNAYQEALAAGTDARETVEKLVEANRETTKAAVDAARTYATNNPFAETMMKNFESVIPNGSSNRKKEKASA